jgi:hypothetical protein
MRTLIVVALFLFSTGRLYSQQIVADSIPALEGHRNCVVFLEVGFFSQ